MFRYEKSVSTFVLQIDDIMNKPGRFFAIKGEECNEKTSFLFK